MQIKQFPHHYESQRKNKAENDANAERNRAYSRQSTIRNRIIKKADVGEWCGSCAGIGFLVGFFACFGVCSATDSGGAGIATWIALSIGGAILGAVLAICINAGHNSSTNSADKEIASEQSRCENAVTEIYAQAARDIASYKSEFEAEAQRMSVKYAESTLATDVINWMTDGFCRTIEAVDRSSHIEKINVPFSFNVYTNKITCNLGTYDFEIKRCANLTSPLQQTAIARAIASSIQLNITMKYPKDVSGTDFVLNISYSYTGDSVSVVIRYTAPNGNYRSVQSW